MVDAAEYGELLRQKYGKPRKESVKRQGKPNKKEKKKAKKDFETSSKNSSKSSKGGKKVQNKKFFQKNRKKQDF